MKVHFRNKARKIFPRERGLPGRQYTSSSQYRYGFNGKEKDDEAKGTGNSYDYGMRIYDSRLGKFMSVDPVTAKYPELTPYQFASNRPIVAIDLDGLEAWDSPNKADDVFSQYSWQAFVKSYSKKVLGPTDDKDCADLAFEMAIEYHRMKGVAFVVQVKAANGKTLTFDSNDKKYQDNTGKDFSGRTFATALEWFLDDVKRNTGPEVIVSTYGSKVPRSKATTGDMRFLFTMNGIVWHSQIVNNDFVKKDGELGFIQASGEYYGRGSKKNQPLSPISTGSSTLNSPFLFRWNFIFNAQKYTQDEEPLYIAPKEIRLISDPPVLELKK